MAKEAKHSIFYIDMGGWNYAWRAHEDAYPKAIRDGLGIKEGKDTDNNLVFGANSPKPAQVRISTANGKTYYRNCQQGKLDDLIEKGSINGKKIYGENINRVTVSRRG